MSHTKIQTIHGLKPPACQLGHILKSSVCALLFSRQGKKDVVHLFSNIVRRQIGTRAPTVEYICSKSEILFMLLRG